MRHSTLLSLAVVFVVYVVTFGLLLPLLCQNLPYSPYYNGTSNKLDAARQIVWANDKRVELAKNYLHSLRKDPTTVARNVDDSDHATSYDLVVVVITINRIAPSLDDEGGDLYNLGYLTQTVAQLLRVFRSDKSTAAFRRKRLLVCNVDAVPRMHAEALDLSDFASVVSRYWNRTDALLDDIREGLYEKEKIDYVYCLRSAAKLPAPYYLVLEDDVLLDELATDTVRFVMEYFGLFGRRDWAFLKLYYPEKWQGYGRSWQTAVEVGAYATLGGFFGGVLPVVSSRHSRGKFRTSWCVAGAAFVGLCCISVGRQYVDTWRALFVSTHRLVAAPGCCTQATLYPAHVVADLCQHLERAQCSYRFPVDLAIDGFAHMRRLRRWVVEPNVARHVGFASSLHLNYL